MIRKIRIANRGEIADRIIRACRNMGIQSVAIHPGFGFLSENSTFVRKCQENHLIFIGPEADVIDRMGNKSAARRTMMDVGVPVVPGSMEPVYDAKTARKIAEEIGYPVVDAAMREKMNEYAIPAGNGVRVDTALYSGYRIPSEYDSMIAKVLVHAPDREAAIRKMRTALDEMVILVLSGRD